MKIIIEPRENFFSVSLASKEGAQPFLTIKGCRIANGSKGPFVSWPSKKLENGKWLQHVWSSDAFNNAVLAEAQKVMAPPKVMPTADSDVPF